MVGEGGKQAFTTTLLIIHADKSKFYFHSYMVTIYQKSAQTKSYVNFQTETKNHFFLLHYCSSSLESVFFFNHSKCAIAYLEVLNQTLAWSFNITNRKKKKIYLKVITLEHFLIKIDIEKT